MKIHKTLRRTLVLTGLLLGVYGVHAQTGDARVQPEAASEQTRKAAWRGQPPAIATANPLATQAGMAVLQAGGCAVDAAIAAQWVLGLVEPQSSGLGGGAFLVYADPQAVVTYDGRETAPMAADENLFMQADGTPLPFRTAVLGGRAVGVPGLVRMLALAHEQHGCLPWAQLATPAIDLATHGFKVSPRLNTLLRANKDLPLDPGAAAYFYNAEGEAWPVGHLLRNPAYADTLTRIATAGVSGFYEGETAQAMVEKVAQHPTNPGLLSLRDLADYRAKVRPAVCFAHQADTGPWQVCGMGPPSSGALAVGQILGTLSAVHSDAGWSATRQAPDAPWLHAYLDSARLAFADRALYVADPDFVAAPGGDWHSLLSPRYLAARAALINTDSDAPSLSPATAGQPGERQSRWGPMPTQPEYGTSHLSVVDSRGHVVAMTSSIETAFGSKQWVAGFLLNNQLTDFSFRPRDAQGRLIANRVQPGKRPRSSMAPTVVLDPSSGKPIASLGSPGGSFIIHYVAKSLWSLAHWGLDAQQAAAAPNFGTTGKATFLERARFDAPTQASLAARGPTVRAVDLTSGTQILIQRGDQWEGGADPRREGLVMGVQP